MICPSESFNLLGSSLWGYYSWCDKQPVGSGCGLSTIGDFPSNFGQGVVPIFSQLYSCSLLVAGFLFYDTSVNIKYIEAYLPTYLLSYLLTYLFTYLLTYLPTDY